MRLLLLLLLVYPSTQETDIGCQSRSDKGKGYKGGANRTHDGTACLPWIDSPHPDVGSHSYCSNPNPEEMDGVWCYTQLGGSMTKHLCNVPFCENSLNNNENVLAPRSVASKVSVGIIKKGCIEEHMTDYNGYEVPGQSNLPEHDLDSCTKLCFHLPACHYWTFSPTQKLCWLKTSNAGKTAWVANTVHMNLISGTKACGSTDVGCQKRSSNGKDYGGKANTSRSGAACKKWTDLANTKRHDVGDHNYCRNPDDEAGGVWCVREDTSSWEHCDVPFCEECETSQQLEVNSSTAQDSKYELRNALKLDNEVWLEKSSGGQGFTLKFEKCNRKIQGIVIQNSGFKSQYSRRDTRRFRVTGAQQFAGPWETLVEEELEDLEGKSGPILGFYFSPRNLRFIRFHLLSYWGAGGGLRYFYPITGKIICQRRSTKGADYQGEVSTTMDGHTCQQWSLDDPQEHGFNDVGEHNYCRNWRGAGGEDGVWCYTTNGPRYQLCDVPFCEDCTAALQVQVKTNEVYGGNWEAWHPNNILKMDDEKWLAGEADNQMLTFKFQKCHRMVHGIIIQNSGHRPADPEYPRRDTRGFRVTGSLEATGPWEVLVEEELEEAIPPPVLTFYFPPRNLRLLRFHLLSYWGAGGGLRYFYPITDWFHCQWRSTKGADYQGLAATTEDDQACLKWPQDNKDYGDNNYCRNLDGDREGVSCETSSGLQLCKVPFCEDGVEESLSQCQWSEWSTCPLYCGSFPHISTRTYEAVDSGLPANSKCVGKEERNCTQPCKERYELGQWEDTDNCTENCGDKGLKFQTRTCTAVDQTFNCSTLDKNLTERVGNTPCNIRDCLVFGNWTDTGNCTEQCGDQGLKIQTRTCSEIDESDDCRTLATNFIQRIGNTTCNRRDCVELGDWTDIGKCTKECGNGTITQNRTCTAYDDSCKNQTLSQTTPCNTHKCQTEQEELVSVAVIAISVSVAVLVLLAVVFLLICLKKNKNKVEKPKTINEVRKTDMTSPNDVQDTKDAKEKVLPIPTNINNEETAKLINSAEHPTDNTIPSHIVLMKDDNLKETAKKLEEKEEELQDEFKKMVEHVKMTVNKTTSIAKKDANKEHNRYLDIVPFDDNQICLSSEMFSSPETNFVNASRITFASCSEVFIAAQAPKPASYRHFWHMVIQERVTVIVMITKLVEKKKRKAHHYWPEEEGEEAEGPVMELGGGCRVEHMETSYTQGCYFLRRFLLTLPGGVTRQVTQIQTEEWPDLTAPEEPRLLLDLVNRTNELHTMQLMNTPGGSILVHCSAGVGRTGTFLALYKLWLDYHNTEVASLAILPTVLALRQQRCLMVQKAPQYVYIARCISFLVKTEEGDYYENVEDVEEEKGEEEEA